jgi:hypothetical protein
MSDMQAIGTITDPLVHGTGPAPDIQQYTGQHLSGFNPHRVQQRNRRCTEAARLFADVVTGKVPRYMLQEAMNPTQEFVVAELQRRYPGIYGDPGGRNLLGLRETMSITDYQALYVDVLDRMYYGYYNAYPIPNKPLCKVHSLRDFRTVKRYLYDGMVTPFTAIDPAAPPSRATRDLFGPTPQNGPTLGPGTSTAAITYAPQAYAAGTAINWAAFVNDDLGIFQDISNRLAMSGTRGIHKFITGQFFDVNGPSATLYTAGYKNIINLANGASVNNPPLNAQGVADALKVLAGMVDAGGDPIMVGGKIYIVYGPAYTAVAQNLKRAITIQLSVEGGTANAQGFPSQFVNVENWIMNDVNLIMDPYIPLVATGNKLSWAVVVDPNGVNRPAVELGFLSGFETPQMYRKLPNTLRVDGGVETMMGDFYSMDQETKIVGVFGAAQIDGRSTVGSNGSGT